MNRPSGSQGQHLPHSQHRLQQSYSNNSPVPIPNGQGIGITRERNGSFVGDHQQNAMGKSPPSLASKNTKHVPCKFFKNGGCQAGTACPFMHTLDPMSQQAPCKYFMKGNCKFGAKCMLAHYLPDGRRVSKADLNPVHAMTSRQYPVNARDDSPFAQLEPNSNGHFLGPSGAEPMYQSNMSMGPGQDMTFLDEDNFDPAFERRNMRNGYGQHTYESHVGSPPTSQFGSPPNEIYSPQAYPSARNAPLPSSWNPNDPTNYAINGPFGQSVPSGFGLASPQEPVSVPAGSRVIGRDSTARPLTQASNTKTTPLGQSPAHGENSLAGRLMHSQRNIISNCRVPMSASLPVRDLDSQFGLESDLPYLPTDLHEEVLTDREKLRRLSRPEQEPSGSFRDRSESLAIPRRSSNVVGSPPAAGSPSRFRAIFEEQQREKTSNVGPVGSPLRETWMLDGNSSVSSRQAMQMSGISQAMARIELNRSDSNESTGVRASGGLRGGYARQISSPGLNSRRIDEVDEGDFFPMDDERPKRGAPAWIEAQATSKLSDESGTSKAGVGGNKGSRPIFGFQQ